MEFIIYGPNGEVRLVSVLEVSFFQPSFTLKYIACAAPIILRLVSRLAMRPIIVLLKGGLNLILRMIGRRGSLLSMSDLKLLESEIFGFSPLMLEAKPVGIRISLSKISTEGAIFYLLPIVFKNDQNISTGAAKNYNVIDAGANIGVFSLYAAKLGAKRVYAFEPVKETYKILKENIRINNMENIIVPVNMALGDSAGKSTIFFDEAGEGTASLLQEGLERMPKKKRSQKVRVTTIDSFMGGKCKTGFIKMDVEGYEEKVLLGARKTIRKYKPVLSFSAYHKKDDKKRLPEVVRRIRKDYSIRLIHGSEDIFYCK